MKQEGLEVEDNHAIGYVLKALAMLYGSNQGWFGLYLLYWDISVINLSSREYLLYDPYLRIGYVMESSQTNIGKMIPPASPASLRKKTQQQL